MTRRKWGPEGPPPEAYSRYTNLERFAPLHDEAERLLSELSQAYAVVRTEGFGLDTGSDRADLSRPTIRLTPVRDSEAPLKIQFTAFPGLSLRLGHWCVERLPACGCDACDESLEAMVENLNFLVGSAVAGKFYEEIIIPPQADHAWRLTEVGVSGEGRFTSRRTRISRSSALDMVRGGSPRSAWQSWTRAGEEE